MPDVPSSVVETDTVQINMMVDSTADSAWWNGLFFGLAYLAIPFLLVTPLVTSILQIVMASEAIEKYANNTMHHFDDTDSANGFSMIHDGNIFISASYPVVLCVFMCGTCFLSKKMFSCFLQNEKENISTVEKSVLFSSLISLILPSISTVVVFVMTSPIAPEFYSSDLHVARMLALVTSSIKMFFITLTIVYTYCTLP